MPQSDCQEEMIGGVIFRKSTITSGNIDICTHQICDFSKPETQINTKQMLAGCILCVIAFGCGYIGTIFGSMFAFWVCFCTLTFGALIIFISLPKDKPHRFGRISITLMNGKEHILPYNSKETTEKMYKKLLQMLNGLSEPSNYLELNIHQDSVHIQDSRIQL